VLGAGIVTTSELIEFVMLVTAYNVESSAPWSETQNGEVAELVMPHGLIKFGSVNSAEASAWLLETRLV